MIERTRALGMALLAAAAMLGSAGAAAAQSTDATEWLERCRAGRAWGGSAPERVCELRELTLPADGRGIAIDGGGNGGITVTGWDRDEIRVQALVSANAPTAAEARADAQAIRIVSDDRRVRADGPRRNGGGWWAVSYRVFVPRGTDLELRAANGALRVSDVTGALDLVTSNGSIALEGVGGTVRGRTSNGSLNVRLAGTTWNGSGLDLQTSNGSVNLQLPDGYSARLEVGTTNGRISTDIPLNVQGTLGRSVRTQLGNGGPEVRVRTTNGSVRLRRA